MTDLEIMQRARAYIEKMANGVNPITDQPVPDYETLNDVRISRCLFYVSDVLRQVIENGGEIGKKKAAKKQPFMISQEQLRNFELSEKPISVSEVTRRINALKNSEEMANLKYKSITDYLMNAGMLQLIEFNDGSKAKEPTEMGRTIGISVEERFGQRGAYRVVLYNLDAQQFILDNMEGIIEIDHKPVPQREMQGKPWTEDQEKTLLELYHQQLPLPEIAKTMQRTKGAIESRLEKLGFLQRNKQY